MIVARKKPRATEARLEFSFLLLTLGPFFLLIWLVWSR
jgi:hypothetical protein